MRLQPQALTRPLELKTRNTSNVACPAIAHCTDGTAVCDVTAIQITFGVPRVRPAWRLQERSSSGGQQDHKTADQTDCHSHQISSVRARSFHDPEPSHRTRDIDTAICSIGAAREFGVGSGEHVGEQDKACGSRDQPDRRLVQPDICPKGKAPPRFQQARREQKYRRP